MTVVQSMVLGAVQGLTEFLPVSSDGHLAVTYRLFGSSPDLAFEVFLHVATLLALVVYFRDDLLEVARSLGPAGKGTPERRLATLIGIATAISGVLALALKRAVEAANESLVAIGAGFLVTAAVLATAELLAARVKHLEPADLGWKRTAAIAVAQALAVLPGVSRSGSTIATGMLTGLTRDKAARFSFLIGVPIMAAAALFEAKDVLTGSAPLPPLAPSAAGFLVAGLVGYLSIRGLLALLRTKPLYAFSVYTALVGAAVIAWGTIA